MKGEKINILIVDDHALVREAWSYMLNMHKNIEVVGECGDGSSAIEMAKQKQPDVILLDISMSPITGFDVLTAVRKYSPGSKVIALSMHSQPIYARKMLRMGAKGYVTKNSSRQEMIDAIIEVDKGNNYICQEVKEILSAQLISQEDEPAGIHHLSEREVEVINFLKNGLSSKEIGDKMNITTKTVEVHRHNILKKLKVKNTASLINFINSEGW